MPYGPYSDIVAALRAQEPGIDAYKGSEDLFRDAAAEIERQKKEIYEWIAFADELERVLELICGQSKDRLMQLHAEQGLRIIRPLHRCP
jgi:hypothetical protein